jgi:hypothetical protein
MSGFSFHIGHHHTDSTPTVLPPADSKRTTDRRGADRRASDRRCGERRVYDRRSCERRTIDGGWVCAAGLDKRAAGHDPRMTTQRVLMRRSNDRRMGSRRWWQRRDSPDII